jgi:nicotinamidase-related amidase
MMSPSSKRISSLFAILCTAALSIASPAALSAGAETIIDTWKTVAVPPPPQLVPVTVDPAHTALLILDMSALNCVEAKRPSCVRSLPHVRRLLDAARAKHMLVIYSAGAASSTAPPDPVAALAPQAGEPMVRAPVDKFFQSDLEKLLADRHVDTVIVTGTSAEGAVLSTATGAALRNMTAIVPVDGYSAIDPFAELYTAWHLKNAPKAISSHVTLTRTDLITVR